MRDVGGVVHAGIRMRIFFAIVCAATAMLSSAALAGKTASPDLPSWPTVSPEAKPWAYNWWMGSAVDAEGIEFQCSEMKKKGFGGFHVIPIYGAKGWESKYREYLSDSWIDGWNMAVRTARRYGLGVDMTMGSGWCFGGPWITEADACLGGMRVKRAGPGGQGPMVDPFSPSSMSNFIARFEAAFGKGSHVAERPRAFYHDSYEYYRAKPKTPGVLEDMQYATFKVWTDWCKKNGYMSRNEAHGSPGNWLDLYALADVPETEMFSHECRDILISKFASSAAHVTGRKLVSSESCTWLGEHFTETLADFKIFIDRLLLSGVNHMFYHGLCYSPVNVTWPGWCFYASSEMNPRNPIWHDVDILNAYVARCQSMFQDSVPDEDTLLYWPYSDSAATVAGDGGLMMTVHNAFKWFHPLPIGATARHLAAEGVQFDYVSDKQLQTLDLSRYGRIVVPEGASVPEKTAAAIAAFRGGREAKAEPFAKAGLSATRFRRGGDTVYFIVNTNAVRIAGRFRPSAKGKAGAMMDPMTGRVSAADWSEEGGFEVALEGGASVFLSVRNGSAARRSAYPQQRIGVASVGRTIEIPGPWRLEPVEGGPEMPPARIMGRLSTWSVNEDGSENPFCGTMRYSTTFDYDCENADEAVIDLGDVRSSARVKVNGKDAGFAIMPPFRVTFPASLLKRKGNLLEVEVTSVGANRIRYNDRTGVNWKYFHDVNMVSYETRNQLDASGWPLRDCGLLGPVTCSTVAR